MSIFSSLLSWCFLFNLFRFGYHVCKCSLVRKVLKILIDLCKTNIEVDGSSILIFPPPTSMSVNKVFSSFLGHPENKSRKYPHQGWNFTYYTQYWWDTYHFKNTYSPIIDLVSIFRCSSSLNNPVYERRVDFSDLVFSLSSHRHSYIGLVFSSHFLGS